MTEIDCTGMSFEQATKVAELLAENEELRTDNERLRATLQDMIEISMRNSEATLMLIAIRKCAERALEQKP